MPRDISSSSLSSSSEDEEPGPETHPEPTEPERTRFQCPADFVSFSYKPCSSTMKANSSSEMWLIKAPASFDPQCFSGVQLPLCGLQTQTVPSREGAELTYSALGSSRRCPELRLLTYPKNAPQRASLASPFAGIISICQSYADQDCSDPAHHIVPAVSPPFLPPGLKQRFQHTAFKSTAPSAEGEVRKKRRREKRIKTEPEEERERAEPEGLRIKIEAKSEPLDPQYGEQVARRKKKKKKSRSDD